MADCRDPSAILCRSAETPKRSGLRPGGWRALHGACAINTRLFASAAYAAPNSAMTGLPSFPSSKVMMMRSPAARVRALSTHAEHSVADASIDRANALADDIIPTGLWHANTDARNQLVTNDHRISCVIRSCWASFQSVKMPTLARHSAIWKFGRLSAASRACQAVSSTSHWLAGPTATAQMSSGDLECVPASSK
jgi:hypothetical protein